MKRAILIASALLIIATGAFAVYSTGWGGSSTVTTTPQRLTGFTLNKVSVLNLDSANPLVFALVNCTTNVLAGRIVSGTAVPIPAGQSYTFDFNGQQNITSLCLATTNGTAVAYCGGE